MNIHKNARLTPHGRALLAGSPFATDAAIVEQIIARRQQR